MTRSLFRGLLCARDISLEGIASLLGLELDAVKLYEGLLFNVRGRGGGFALNRIFPQTRLGAVREAELDCNEVVLTLMRVSRDYGWKAAAQLAGLISLEDADESPETMLANMERTMAANTRMLVRAGHLKRKDSAGIRHEKSLMMRAKNEVEMNHGIDPDSHGESKR